MSRKQSIRISAGSILLTLAVFLCVTALLRRSGDLIRLLGPAFDLSAKDVKSAASILDQLRQAAIRLPAILTLLFSTGISWLLISHKPERKAIRLTLKICLAPLLILLLFLFTLLLTKVNGIRVVNLLRALLPLLNS